MSVQWEPDDRATAERELGRTRVHGWATGYEAGCRKARLLRIEVRIWRVVALLLFGLAVWR